MTREEAVAHIRRLCPPGTLEALRPSGGHHLPFAHVGNLAPPVDPEAERLVDAAVNARLGRTTPRPLTRRAAVEEHAATGSDPRAELEEVPTRRERRPESVTGFAAVKPALQEGRDAAGLEKP